MAENNIEGMKELSAQLNKIGTTLAGKALRQAAGASVNPIVKQLKMAAPVGTRAHKTYKGRLVAPGFLRRSVRKKTRLRKGTAIVTIGVLNEAFYGVSFVESGLENRNMKAQPWFIKTFIRNRMAVEKNLASELKKRIERAAASKAPA